MKESNFIRPVRPVIGVPHYVLDDTIETEQGKEQTIATIYHDFVLGRLDPSQIGGEVQYDPDGSNEIDPFNHFGLTLEETTELAERGSEAAQQVHSERLRKAKAKAEAAELEKQTKLEAELRKKIESEQKAS